MREQLIQYVDLLFAGAPGSGEVKQEILQNTLDRYDDLVSQGKPEEAAYRLAISGIGDINEILGSTPPEQSAAQEFRSALREETEHIQSRKMRAVAIALYIVCAIPLFILSEFGMATLGLCLTLLLVAAATYMILLAKKNSPREDAPADPLPPHRQSIAYVIRTASLVVFLVLSFLTGAWHTTWLVFPIAACVRGLVFAILDLKEAISNEN